MSLVAYGSSDESEGSDAEDATTATVQPVAAVNSSGGPKMAPDSGGDISDEDEGPHQRAGDGDKNIDSLLKGAKPCESCATYTYLNISYICTYGSDWCW